MEERIAALEGKRGKRTSADNPTQMILDRLEDMGTRLDLVESCYSDEEGDCEMKSFSQESAWGGEQGWADSSSVFPGSDWNELDERAPITTRNTNINSASCGICKASFSTAAALDDHMRQEHSVSCPHCRGVFFKDQTMLKRHLQEAHIRCQFCSKIYPREFDIQRHYFTEHRDEVLKLQNPGKTVQNTAQGKQ